MEAVAIAICLPCREIRRPGYRGQLEATGRASSDDGFDARGFEITDFDEDTSSAENDDVEALPKSVSDRLWLIQYKREKSLTPAKIKKHLDDIPDTSTDGLYGVIFVAACDFSKKTRDVFRDWCRSKGISEAHIWGKAELEDQLYQPKNDGLLFAYFGLAHPGFRGGEVGLKP
jgi:hypothetical protein